MGFQPVERVPLASGPTWSSFRKVMPTKIYKFDPWARIFFGVLLSFFWGFAILALVFNKAPIDIKFAIVLIGFSALPLPLLDCVLWQLRLDERGVTQTVYGWNAFWPWEDFSTGVIKKVEKARYLRSDWPWWKPGRKLFLSLERDDRNEVEALFDRLIGVAEVELSSANDK